MFVGLLAGPIMLWNLIRHLRRLPSDNAVPYRGATFYNGDGSEVQLEIPEMYEGRDAIEVSIAAMES